MFLEIKMSQRLNNTHENIFRFLQFFIAGFAGLAYQIVSFKLISSSGIGDAISVAISLTAFVSLSGIGALLGGRLSHKLTGWLEIALGGYASILFGLLLTIGISNFTIFSGFLPLVAKLIAFLLIISPLAIISGMLIPLHQRRLPESKEDNDFLRFFFVYVLFHIGGGLSLILIDIYGFSFIGWLQVGLILGLISFFNGISILRTKVTSSTESSDGYSEHSIKYMLLFGLLALSIITGYVGIISYRLFDYLVETNIRNYTLVTAFVFFGLSLSAIIAKKIKLNFRGILGATALGILSIFIAPVVIPPLANTLIEFGVNTWWIYGIAAFVLIVPLYALIGVSIPSAIRLGGRSDHVLFIVSIGNAIGYWLFILTAHYNVDTYVLLFSVFILGILSTRWFMLSILILGGLLYTPISNSFHSASHQIFLHNYVVHENMMVDDFWKKIDGNLSNPEDLTYNVYMVESWNTYGWGVDHIELEVLNEVGEEDYRDQYYILSGSKSLSLLPPEGAMFDESLVATIPAFFVENKDRALVLGSGSGISANVPAKHFNHTDVIDISPDTESILNHFGYTNENVIDDINVIKQDALSFMLDPKRVKENNKYDYIFSTVTGSGYPMSSLLYTKEFFDASNNALDDDGVFSIWMDRRFDMEEGAPDIMASMKEVFPYVQRYVVTPKNSYIDLSAIFLPYQVVVASKKPLVVADNNGELLEFMKKKYKELEEESNGLNFELTSVDNILSDRLTTEPLNTSMNTSGINSMEYAYSFLTRHQVMAKLINAKDLYQQNMNSSGSSSGTSNANMNDIDWEEMYPSGYESESEPFDFSPDSPLDPAFDPGPDFDKNVEIDQKD
jgi:spermidine synthase